MKYLNGVKKGLLLAFIALLSQNNACGMTESNVQQGAKEQTYIPSSQVLAEFVKKLILLKKAGSPIKMGDFADFINKAGLPNKYKDLFKKVNITNFKIDKGPEGFQDSIMISGDAQFKNEPIKVQLIIVKKEKAKLFSLGFKLPAKFNISNVFPELKSLGKLSLQNGAFVLSEFQYKDTMFDFEVSRGLNFAADFNLSGPVQKVQDFVNNLKKGAGKLGQAFTFEGDNLKFVGVIREDITQSEFTGFVPLTVGLDFTKFTKDPKVLTYLKIGNIEIRFTPIPTLEQKVTASIVLGVPGQKEPLELRAGAEFSPNKTTILGNLEGMWESAFGQKWLDIGDFGISIDFDYALLPELLLVGIPFTGVGFRGTMNLAEDKRTTIALSGALSLESGANLGDLVLQGQMKELRISDFINYLIKKISKKPVSFDIPTINLSNLELYVVPKETEIAGKKYKQGISVTAEATIEKQKGRVKFNVDPQELKISGEGWLSNIIIPETAPVFKLTGPGLDKKYGTQDDGPTLSFDLLLHNPAASSLMLAGVIEIPPLRLKEKTELKINALGIEGKIEATIANVFDTIIQFKAPIDNPQNFIVSFDLTNKFKEFLENELIEKIEKSDDFIIKTLVSPVVRLVQKGLSIINVKKAAVEINGKELAEGKSPTIKELIIEINLSVKIFGVKIGIQEEINLKDVQFDFKDIGNAAELIINKLIKAIKKALP